MMYKYQSGTALTVSTFKDNFISILGRGWRLTCLFLFALTLTTSISYAQVVISGTVTSAADGSPLPGVNVLEKGTMNGTSTDVEGNYEIEVSGPDAVLTFTYISFITQETVVGDRETINIQLEEDVQLLEDVVVVGYGEQDRKTLTSAVSSISAEDVANTPVAGSDQLMQGRAAGVQVSANSGTPGGGIFVKIRGTSSISGGSDPLYVVDGVPIQTGDFGLGLGGETTSALADVDPSDIESIEILKDASATAIYGARAANGVVLITTKRGSFSEPRVSFTAYTGFEEPVNTPDLVSGPEFEMLMNEAARNNGQPEPYANPQSAIDTDWGDQVFRTGRVSSYDLTVSGGNENIKYSVSGSNFDQDGVVKPATYTRSSARLNLDILASEKLTFGTSTTYSFSNRNRARNNDNITGVLGGVYFLPSNLPVYNSEGGYTKFSIFENPVAAANEVDFNMDVNRLIGNVFADYEFIPGLTFRTSWSLDYNQIKEDRYDNTFLNNGSAVNGSALSTVALIRNWTAENTLSYLFDVGKNDFSVLLGTSVQESKFERTTAEGEQFPSNDFRRIEDAAVQTALSTGTSWGIASFFGRVKYEYDSKYLATLTVRRDGSSRFGENNRWGTFPSVALGWLVSEESFFEVGAISELKFRASYGITGNQSGIDNFQSRGLWGGESYTDSPGTSPIQLANPDLKWETTKQLDIGVDLGLFEDRVNLVFDYYNKKTEDLLLAVPVPLSTGFAELVQNFGELENKGIEFSVAADIIQTTDANWNVLFNIAGNRNKILKLAAPFNVYNRDIYRYEEGKPMYSFYFHEQTGVDPQTGAPIFTDVDGDGTFNPNVDRKIVGDANPDFFGGITNRFNYKNFDLSVFFQYSYGNEQLHWNRFFQEHGGARNTGYISTQLDRWQEPGDKTMVPRMTSANYAGNLRPSRFVEDGSYMRLKNATIGYTLPVELLSKLGVGISRARIYLTGQNLLTFTNYTGLDPEVTATASTALTRGIEFYTMPQARSIIGGIDLSF
ncbi:SusC/RagA family TonB-linked outer membrane protein [Gracilimonas mengyeensis]|uniref:TonB-linked outer membrane protein, SusC/RagA family n=1 Tax=Gracilimonas mengyeensis TaxID=1302730 RepID=A0A521BBV5_9BACT|nr:TonB-dependent receptor [Gracilimonas mengyeensis]SMO44573.1 TonB-linked outer membrane protein, SusC/RagA family [Gracilimonas mengyeensis]